METYQEACMRHATRQGLDPIRDALRAAGFVPALEQTGGFCMTLSVPCVNPGSGIVWVTDDTSPILPDGEHEYLVCRYGPGDYGQEALDQRYVTSLREVLAAVREMTGALPSPDPGSALTFDEVEAAGLDGTLRDR